MHRNHQRCGIFEVKNKFTPYINRKASAITAVKSERTTLFRVSMPFAKRVIDHLEAIAYTHLLSVSSEDEIEDFILGGIRHSAAVRST